MVITMKECIKVVLATRNKHKTAELTELFSDLGFSLGFVTLDEAGFDGEIAEDGNSFEDNALIKARTAARECKMTAVADDSGLEVDALGGKPGIYSARYAGTGSDADNNRKLLSEMEVVPDEKRTARFVCAMALVMPDGAEIAVRGTCEGTVTRAPRGSGTFGYDPLFFYPPLGATFAELSPAQKNSVSHRGRAVRLLAEKIASDEKICNALSAPSAFVDKRDAL